MRLLVITARYPIPEQPAAGIFVQRRLADPDLRATVVAPSTLRSPWWLRYGGLLWRGLAARGRFDGVEGHFALPSGVVALFVARLRRLPLVVVAHGSDVGAIADRHRVLGWLARRVVGGADLVVANSEHTRARVERLGAEAIVIHPGIELGAFTVEPRPAERRVLYLGGVETGKGYDIARKLADTLRGPGLEVAEPSQVPALLAAHDVLLVPSRAEAFGIAAAEAIAAGRWVVAADVGGLREVVTDGVNGTLVADGDYARAIRDVPDYDPAAVAATAARFDVSEQRRAMAAAWNAVLQRRG
jgi:glycogen synthase